MTRPQQKVWLVLLLFVHLLVHPTLHGFSLLATNTQVSQDTGSSAGALDDCGFCRGASTLTLTPSALQVHWQPVIVQVLPTLSVGTHVSFESSAVSPRAPPAF